jgi:hypothetical protein
LASVFMYICLVCVKLSSCLFDIQEHSLPLAKKRPLAADVEDCSATAFIIASFCAFVCGIDQGHFWGHLDVFVQNLNRCKWKSSSTTLYFDTSSSYDVAQFGFDTCDFLV